MRFIAAISPPVRRACPSHLIWQHIADTTPTTSESREMWAKQAWQSIRFST